VRYTEAVDQLRGLIQQGFELQLVFSDMAEHLYGSWMRGQLAGFPHWSHWTDYGWLRSLREARAVVVPLMSVNTLSKLALLIADSQTGNLILHGLFMGKPVIVASDGVENDQPDRAQLGFDKGLPALTRVVDERLKIIAGYGCKVVGVGQLNAVLGAALPKAPAQEAQGAQELPRSAETKRALVRHESALITAGDVLEAHSRQFDLWCAAKTLMTPLARDLAGKRQMLIARVIGTVVASRKHERLVGSKIQIVQPLEPDGETAKGDTLVAVDAVGAGVGELVLLVQGSSARMALDNESCPVDATIVGIIDQIDVEE
jgi:ethanolamine utilization protein EutN